MFVGRTEHVLDSKGRLTIPSRYRTALAPGGMVTRGMGDYLIVLPLSEWQGLAERLQDKPMLTDLAIGELRRWLYAEAADVELDTQGRFILPPDLRAFASITDNVTVAGVGTHLELWAPTLWQDRRAHLMQDNEMTSLFRALSI